MNQKLVLTDEITSDAVNITTLQVQQKIQTEKFSILIKLLFLTIGLSSLEMQYLWNTFNC